uniref:Uncharacterized protein n=1 Tax=Thermofilum pendens TaxID=2269 RepID=A0A7C4BAM2_THEPE
MSREEDLEVRRNRPGKVALLFVGESPPRKTFFYDTEGSVLGWATLETFEKAFRTRFKSYPEFLKFFRPKGCYLVDLFQERGRKAAQVSEEEVERAVRRLAKVIAECEPLVVVAVLKSICGLVREAVKASGVNARVVCVPFPRGRVNRERYVEELARILEVYLAQR